MRTFLIPLLIGFTSFGCGNLKQESKKAQRQADVRSELTGNWSMDCQPSKLEEGKHSKLVYNFDAATTYTFTTDTFSDAQCQTQESAIKVNGQYNIPGEVRPGSHEVNLNIDDITVTPKTDSVTTQYNNEQRCGFTDWQTNVEKSVVDKECQGIPVTSKKTLYQKFQITDEKLYLGEAQLLAAPQDEANRPESVNLNRPFTK